MMEEIADINLDSSGELMPAKNDKIALIDADTLVFAAALNAQIEEELLPQEFYTDVEWMELTSDPNYDPETNSIRFMNMELAYANAEEKITTILNKTGCVDFELHFTGPNKNSFRYTMIDSEYKANRREYIAPVGLVEIKIELSNQYPDKVYVNRCYEADDTVVAKKKACPDKYILCAVDKDVLYSLPGRHFNYYANVKYNIDMQFIEVDEETAMKHHWSQVLMGDPGDNVIGLKGIGKKRAAKLLSECITDSECKQVVIKAYEDAGRSPIDVITNMRLVNMQQVEYDTETKKFKLKLYGKDTYEEC